MQKVGRQHPAAAGAEEGGPTAARRAQPAVALAAGDRLRLRLARVAVGAQWLALLGRIVAAGPERHDVVDVVGGVEQLRAAGAAPPVPRRHLLLLPLGEGPARRRLVSGGRSVRIFF